MAFAIATCSYFFLDAVSVCTHENLLIFFFPLQVELDLKPIHSMQHHQKPLVFVLNSHQRVTWNVKAENLALNIKHIFYVSPAA